MGSRLPDEASPTHFRAGELVDVVDVAQTITSTVVVRWFGCGEGPGSVGVNIRSVVIHSPASSVFPMSKKALALPNVTPEGLECIIRVTGVLMPWWVSWRRENPVLHPGPGVLEAQPAQTV